MMMDESPFSAAPHGDNDLESRRNRLSRLRNKNVSREQTPSFSRGSTSLRHRSPLSQENRDDDGPTNEQENLEEDSFALPPRIYARNSVGFASPPLSLASTNHNATTKTTTTDSQYDRPSHVFLKDHPVAVAPGVMVGDQAAEDPATPSITSPNEGEEISFAYWESQRTLIDSDQFPENLQDGNPEAILSLDEEDRIDASEPGGLEEAFEIDRTMDFTKREDAKKANLSASKRANELSMALPTPQAPLTPRPGVLPPLHGICLTAETPAELWSAANLISVASAAQSDIAGRLPLHCLSQNMVLAETLAYADQPHKHDQQVSNNCSDESQYPGLEPTLSLDKEVSSMEEQLINYIQETLLQTYPAAMISEDAAGNIPFEGLLTDWVMDAHDDGMDGDDSSTSSRTFSAERISTIWNKSVHVISHHWPSSQQKLRLSATNNQATPLPHTQGTSKVVMPDVESGRSRYGTPGGDSSCHSRQAGFSHTSEHDRFFPNQVRLTAGAYYALKMLSAIVDYFDKHLVTAHMPRSKCLVQPPPTSRRNSFGSDSNSLHVAMDELRNLAVEDHSAEVVESIASIPHLIKVILLMDNKEQRDFVLGTTIVRRVLASRCSVGGWLTGMLQSNEKRVNDKAIEYLHLASGIIVEKTPVRFSRRRSNAKLGAVAANCSLSTSGPAQHDLDYEVSRLQGFVPALLSLGERQVEEASTTLLVRRVLDRIISRPFCGTVLVFDALFMAILIAGFRAAVNHLLWGSSSETVLKFIYVANCGLFYFIIRELGAAVSLCMITRKARIYFYSFWNLTGLLSTLLTLGSVLIIRSGFSVDDPVQVPSTGLRNLLAVTTGFLWLRVLGFLKGINMQLATFVLAIVQITRDVLWFCVIILTLIASFSQMFFTLLAPEECATDSGGNERECYQSEYYLRVYALLIFQEFHRENFSTVFSVLLVVVYTFMVVLVLLNVLIAVASDSYEKCLIRSQNLFGRARVMMIAELVSFQNLLRQHDEDEHSSIYNSLGESSRFSGWTRGSLVFFGLSSLVVFVWIVGEIAGYSAGPGYGNVFFSLGSVFVNIALFVGIMVFLSSGAMDGGRSGTAKGSGNEERRGNGGENIFQRAMLRLLGVSGDVSTNVNGITGDAEWRGRIFFLQSEMERISEETKQDTSEKILGLETSLRKEMAKAMRDSMTSSSGQSNVEPLMKHVLETLQEIQTKLDESKG